MHITDQPWDRLLATQTLVLRPFGPETAAKVLDFLVNCSSPTQIYLSSERPAALFAEFGALCTPVIAAGGLVLNERGEALLIHRNERWDLPKGKQEPNEPIETTALREVEEETGVTPLTLDRKLCTMHHIYFMEKKVCMKQSHWYLMHTEGTPQLTPQQEEGITQAVWSPMEKVLALMPTTYPSIRRVLQCYSEGKGGTE